MSLEQINGRACSWGHLTVTCGLVRITGFTSLEYSDAVTEALGYGMGPAQAPDRRSIGTYEAGECKLTGYTSKVQELLRALADISPDPGNASGVDWQLVGVYAGMLAEPPQTDVLNRCRILSVSAAYSAGPDLLAQDITIKPLSISRNGVRLYSQISF